MFLLFSCGKDKTISDYHQKKVDEAIAQMQSVSGVYRGQLKNDETKELMGELEIELSPKTSTVNTQDNSTIEAQVFLQAKVILHSKNDTQVVIEKASYFAGESLSQTNFSGKITINLSDKSTATMSITGRITGNQFYGEITPDLLYGIKGIFELAKDAPLVNKSSEVSTQPEFETEEYFGTYKDPLCKTGNETSEKDKCITEAYLQLQSINYSTSEEFYKFFTYERNIVASMTLYTSIGKKFITGYSFDNKTVFDLKKGTLTGKGTFTVKKASSNISLDCKRNENFLACVFITQSNGIARNIDFYPKINYKE